LRAGLLSNPEVIRRLNKQFVSSSILFDDLEKRAASGDELAKLLVGQWRYPIEMMFLTPSGKLVSELNASEDFPQVHPDVAAPSRSRLPMTDERTHAKILLKHVSDHFGKK
jgi:hypothetical protein